MSDARGLPPDPSPGPRFAARAEYLAWADAQPRGRTERVAGEVVAMVPERAAHVRAKYGAWLALREAVAAAGVPCETLGDGITVHVGEDTDYEPDAVVNCGARTAPDAVAVPDPVVVVEVLSPGTRVLDTRLKLTDYFRVPSVRHYLILHAGRRTVIQHRRGEDGAIETRPLAEGGIALDPPGITVTVETLFRDA